MTIRRMEHVGIVVDDLAAATAFFVELGLKVQDDTTEPFLRPAGRRERRG